MDKKLETNTAAGLKPCSAQVRDETRIPGKAQVSLMTDLLFGIFSISNPAQNDVLYINLGLRRHRPEPFKKWAREDISTILSNRDEEGKQNTECILFFFFFPYIMWEIQAQTLPMKIPDNINGSQSP